MRHAATLINILAGRKGIGELSGEMSIFGERITDLSEALKRLQHAVAYVPQSEAFFPMQTRKLSFASSFSRMNNLSSMLVSFILIANRL